jgi:RND family efflux transporter MFP subunit
MSSVIYAPGTIVSRNDAQIASEVSGRLVSVAEIGEFIAAGELIAKVDDTFLKLELQNADAIIKRLQANLTYRNNQLERFENLARQQSASVGEMDEVRSQRDMAEQDLVQARVARAQIKYRLDRTRVTAPFSGRIVERHRQGGEYISIGGEVVRLVDTTNIEVQARAPMDVAEYVKAGLPVSVKDDKGRESNGQIRAVVPVGDERSRLIEVRVALDEQPWVIGAAVRVALPKSPPQEVVAVPRDALILRQNVTYVYKLNDDSTVEQVSVVTGVGNGPLVEVRGNVKAGDEVVTLGGERLRPGQTVSIAET